MTEILGIAAGCFGVLMGASPLLQALRAHKLQSSGEISLPFFLVLVIGGSLWLAYGIALRNPAIIVANSVGVLSSLTAIFVALRWR